METRKYDWITSPARPKAEHDRAGLRSIERKGAPSHLGHGFGEAWARKVGVCQFGPRLQLPDHSALGKIVREMDDIARLVRELSEVHEDGAG